MVRMAQVVVARRAAQAQPRTAMRDPPADAAHDTRIRAEIWIGAITRISPDGGIGRSVSVEEVLVAKVVAAVMAADDSVDTQADHRFGELVDAGRSAGIGRREYTGTVPRSFAVRHQLHDDRAIGRLGRPDRSCHS